MCTKFGILCLFCGYQRFYVEMVTLNWTQGMPRELAKWKKRQIGILSEENSNKPRGSRKLILFLAMLSIITPVQNLSRITNPIFTEYLVHTQHCAAR